MYTLVINENKRAILNKSTSVYQGENYADIIHIMIVPTYNELSIKDECVVMYSFYTEDETEIIDSGEIGDWLNANNGYLESEIPITKNITQNEGRVILGIEILSTANDLVAKANSVGIEVNHYPKSDKALSEGTLSLLEQWEFRMTKLKEHFENSVNEVIEIKENINDTADALNSEIETVNKNIESVKNIKNEVDSTKAETDEIKMAVKALYDDTNGIKDIVNTVYENTLNVADTVNTQSTEVNTKYSEILTKTNAVNDVYTNVVTVRNEVKAINENVNSKYTAIEEMEQSVTGTESVVKSVLNEVNGVKAEVNSAKSEIDNVHTDVISIQGNISNALTTVTTAATNVKTIESNIRTIETDIGSIKNEISDIQEDVNLSKIDIESIHEDVTKSRDSVAENTAKAESDCNAVNTIRTELNDKISDVNDKIEEVKNIGKEINSKGELFDSIKTQVNINTSNINTLENNVIALNSDKANINHTHTADDVGAVSIELKGVANGIAELDDNGLVPSSQLPSYVDDVIEGIYENGKFYATSEKDTEIAGESGKIYIDLISGKDYRWSGSAFVSIPDNLSLVITSSTAFRGDCGNIAYLHSLSKGKELAKGLYKITANAEGHIVDGEIVSKEDISELGIVNEDDFNDYKESVSDSVNAINLAIDENGKDISIIDSNVKANAQSIKEINTNVNNLFNVTDSILTDKEDAEEIIQVSDTIVTIPCVHNKEYRCGTISSITFTVDVLPNVSNRVEYLVCFKTGETVPAVKFDNRIKLKESSDVEEVDGVLTFVPKTNYAYMIAVMWTGSDLKAIVRGDAI